MTTKSLKFPYGFTLELLAVSNALHAENPNSRSPAFAIQAVYKLAKDALKLEHTYDLVTKNIEIIDDVIRDQVTWNEQECHWQTGKGTNVSFNNIKQDAIRWYAHGWDFKRHTRDTEVEYPEDFENCFSSDEIKHLANSLLPAKDELTRRIFTPPNNNSCFYYIDVLPLENGQYSAEFGRFGRPEYHRIVGTSKNFWDLEINTILPLLQGRIVLKNTFHHIVAKMGGVK
jgi:hypothetical protein